MLVGFTAELSGRNAELGVQERNGVALAVEHLNGSGGIAGRPLKVIVRDDLGTPEGTAAGDRQLLGANVVAIIGHATSKTGIVAVPIVDAAHVLMISPTISAPQFSGISRYFFRVMVSNHVSITTYAEYLYQHRGVRRMGAVWDTDNGAYSRPLLKSFSSRFESLGGTLIAADFSSSAAPDFAPLLKKLQSAGAEGLLIVATDFDSALIAQRARLIGWRVPLFGTPWAQTELLIANGGGAVDGLELVQAFPEDGEAPRLRAFRSEYEAHFGRKPSFGAAFGYEAAMALATALRATRGGAQGLREALLTSHGFQGLVDSFSFDERGDVVRPTYVGGVRDGRFVTLRTLPARGR